MVTVIVYLVLVIMAIALYFLSRSKRKTGTGQSFFAWLRQGASQIGGQPAGTRVIRAPRAVDGVKELTDDDFDQVLKMLDDIYKEVYSEREKFRSEMDAAFTNLRAEFQARIYQLEERLKQQAPLNDGPLPAAEFLQKFTSNQVSSGQDLGPVAAAVDVSISPPAGGSGNFDEMYFKILDELHSGRSVQEISINLGVSTSEIEMVRRLMNMHNS